MVSAVQADERVDAFEKNFSRWGKFCGDPKINFSCLSLRYDPYLTFSAMDVTLER